MPPFSSPAASLARTRTQFPLIELPATSCAARVTERSGSRIRTACGWKPIFVSGPLDGGESEFRAVSDDQSIITGYAIDLPGTNFLPPEHWLAYRLSGALEGLYLREPELLLGPDGKVTVIYEQDTDRSRVTGFSTSLQQKVNGPAIELHRAALSVLKNELAAAAAAIPEFDPAVPGEVYVDGAGNFGGGWAGGDNGLTARGLCRSYVRLRPSAAELLAARISIRQTVPAESWLVGWPRPWC